MVHARPFGQIQRKNRVEHDLGQPLGLIHSPGLTNPVGLLRYQIQTLCVVKQPWLHLKSEQPDTGLL